MLVAILDGVIIDLNNYSKRKFPENLEIFPIMFRRNATHLLASYSFSKSIYPKTQFRLPWTSITGITSCLCLWTQSSTPLSCSPTFSGVPVAATFLMHQAYDLFESAFPGLEMSSIFNVDHADFNYVEHADGLLAFFGPSAASVTVPVFERLSQVEEERLGTAGIRKTPVGSLIITGRCQLGCAKVTLEEMTLMKSNGDIVWTYEKGN